MRKVILSAAMLLGLTVLGGAIYMQSSAREVATEKAATITCPLTGQPISPCCCPLKK